MPAENSRNFLVNWLQRLGETDAGLLTVEVVFYAVTYIGLRACIHGPVMHLS